MSIREIRVTHAVLGPRGGGRPVAARPPASGARRSGAPSRRRRREAGPRHAGAMRPCAERSLGSSRALPLPLSSGWPGRLVPALPDLRGQIGAGRRDLGLQTGVEHVADLQHAARPLAHAAEFGVAELGLAATTNQGVPQRFDRALAQPVPPCRRPDGVIPIRHDRSSLRVPPEPPGSSARMSSPGPP